MCLYAYVALCGVCVCVCACKHVSLSLYIFVCACVCVFYAQESTIICPRERMISVLSWTWNYWCVFVTNTNTRQ